MTRRRTLAPDPTFSDTRFEIIITIWHKAQLESSNTWFFRGCDLLISATWISLRILIIQILCAWKKCDRPRDQGSLICFIANDWLFLLFSILDNLQKRRRVLWYRLSLVSVWVEVYEYINQWILIDLKIWRGLEPTRLNFQNYIIYTGIASLWITKYCEMIKLCALYETL